MTWAHAAILVAAGLVGGFINGVVGTGSLITFPALLICGYSPVSSNVTNTFAMIPGYIGNSIAYRRELTGQKRRITNYGIAAAVGSIGGAVALLTAPAHTFRDLVPFLIFASAGLMAAQTRIKVWVANRTKAVGSPASRAAARRSREGETLAAARPAGRSEFSVTMMAFMVLAGAYAGYFGAGVSVILLAVLGAMLPESLQRMNALRSILTVTGNALAAVVFVIMTSVVWSAAAIMGVASFGGGYLGSATARHIPDEALRWSVVAFSVAVGVVLLVT